MKATITPNISYPLLLAALALLLAGCRSSEPGRASAPQAQRTIAPANTFTVPGQIMPADDLFSLQLHREGNRQSAPILELHSRQQLQLSFEILGFESRQLQIRFTHHNPDWSRSSLAEEFYLDGFFFNTLPQGRMSSGNRPSYRTFTYSFPNESVRFLESGNYMLWVEDADSGSLLFTLPFFIFENMGEIASSVETITTPRRDLRTAHYPRTRYTVPDLVEMPQFDLEYYYVQNQFWGRMRPAREIDTSDPDEVFFEMRREEPFVGDFEFQFLSLQPLSQQAAGIRGFDPTTIPPQVVLFDDAQGFSASPSRILGNRFGNPNRSLSAQYANVFFTFDPAAAPAEGDELFLVGDFTNWSLRSNYRLRYREEIDRWQTNGIIKEGTYAYKYVRLRDGRIDDLALDDAFTRAEQEYHAFVYFEDPDRFFHRLLQINHFFARSN
ncbi:MAG: type IX secretion system plug protein domain-containing protein [Balneolaceae bacterium]